MSGIYEFNGDELHGDGREVHEPGSSPDQGKPSVCPKCGSQNSPRGIAGGSVRHGVAVEDDGTKTPYYARTLVACRDPWHSSPVPAATTAYGMVTHPKWPDPTWDTGIQNSEDDLMSTSLVPEGLPESRVNSPFSNRASAPQADSVPLSVKVEAAVEQVIDEAQQAESVAFMEELANPNNTPSLDVDSDFVKRIPAGKDAATIATAIQRKIWKWWHDAKGDFGYASYQQYVREEIRKALIDFAASETAALRAERDKWRDLEEHEAKFSQALERENASLKRRIDDLEGRNG